MGKIFLIFIFLISSNLIYSADIYVILTCDTIALNIEESIKADFHHMQTHASHVAQNTSLNLHLTTLIGKNALPIKLKECLDNLEVTNNDIILFYFSGHGYRVGSKFANPWPNLYFTTSDEGVDFNWITLKLLEKKPKFLLAITDCCNHFLAANEIEPPLVEMEFKEKRKKFRIKKNYKRLFLESKGALMIASAIAGQQAWCYPNGGVYTNAFLESLAKRVEKEENVSWEMILNDAAHKVSVHQKPIHLFLNN